uniref:F-box associated domain-containing protein n=1 Tax=Tanacetum cinerariifolium TaxID=118510 RepID=A0A699H2C3_TANCI|nr:hypothetical protein [Tanacetum cinerariifolium]
MLDSSNRWRIVSLDLAKDTYGEVFQSEYDGKGHNALTLGVLGELLCVLCNYSESRVVDVWVMKVYEVKDSWTKVFYIPYPADIWWDQCLDPLCISIDGKDLLKFGSKLLVYDSKDSSSIMIDKLDRRRQVCICLKVSKAMGVRSMGISFRTELQEKFASRRHVIQLLEKVCGSVSLLILLIRCLVVGDLRNGYLPYGGSGWLICDVWFSFELLVVEYGGVPEIYLLVRILVLRMWMRMCLREMLVYQQDQVWDKNWLSECLVVLDYEMEFVFHHIRHVCNSDTNLKQSKKEKTNGNIDNGNIDSLENDWRYMAENKNHGKHKYLLRGKLACKEQVHRPTITVVSEQKSSEATKEEKILGLTKGDGEEIKRCYISYMDVFTSYYKIARAPHIPTKVKEDSESLVSYQWNMDRTSAPKAVQKENEKLEHFRIKLEDETDCNI